MLKRVIWGFLSLFVFLEVQAKPLSGTVEKQAYQDYSNMIFDSRTGTPVSRAKINVPSQGFSTSSGGAGQFSLNGISTNKPFILSVQAEGYKPFSITITKEDLSHPLKLALEKSSGEIAIDRDLHHLGDDSYSPNSANAADFRSNSTGPVFVKSFFIPQLNNRNAYLKIGSIIGIDTKMANYLGQKSRTSSSSSPTSVFVNSQKIGEIRINGDGQEILIPRDIIRQNAPNVISIKTGRNLNKLFSIDYDDIEFMNLSLEFR